MCCLHHDVSESGMPQKVRISPPSMLMVRESPVKTLVKILVQNATCVVTSNL